MRDATKFSDIQIFPMDISAAIWAVYECKKHGIKKLTHVLNKSGTKRGFVAQKVRNANKTFATSFCQKYGIRARILDVGVSVGFGESLSLGETENISGIWKHLFKKAKELNCREDLPEENDNL